MRRHQRGFPALAHPGPALFGLLLLACASTIAAVPGHAEPPPALVHSAPGQVIELPDTVAVRPGTLHRITLDDGTIHFGRILEDADPLRLETVTGRVISVDRTSIADTERVRGTLRNGRFWPADSNETRLFFGPTGRSIPRGHGSFNSYYGIVPFVAVGITDRISMGGGTPLLMGTGTFGRIIWLTPKVQVIRSDVFQAAVGSLSFLDLGRGGDGLGVVYGVGSYLPRPETGITAGIGWGYAGTDLSNRAVVMLGADHRVSRRVKLVTENYVLSGSDSLVSGGVRILGERFSADLALVTSPGAGGAVPLVNFSVGW